MDSGFRIGNNLQEVVEIDESSSDREDGDNMVVEVPSDDDLQELSPEEEMLEENELSVQEDEFAVQEDELSAQENDSSFQEDESAIPEDESPDHQSHNVTGIRPVVGADGNVTYEFICNATSVEEIHEEPLAAEAASPHPPPSEAESLLAEEVWLDSDVEDDRPNQEYDDTLPNLDEDNLPGPSNMVDGAPSEIEIVDEIPGPSRRSDRTSWSFEFESPSLTPRRKKRRRRKDGYSSAPKKRKTQKPKVPVVKAELKPKVHRETIVRNGDEEDCLSQISLYGICPIKIDIGTEDAERGPRLGPLVIHLKEEILDQVFEAESKNCREIILQVTSVGCLLKVTIESELTEEDAKNIYGLKCHDSKRKINNILVEIYYYHCELDGLPLQYLDETPHKKFNKTFTVAFEKICGREVELGLYLLKSEIIGKHSLSEIPVQKSPMAIRICNAFLGVANIPDKVKIKNKEDIEWFYGQIKKYHAQENLPTLESNLIENSFLVPKLRQYQEKAVLWMLSREGYLNLQYKTEIQDVFKERMYSRQSVGSWNGYYNPFVGYFCSSTPVINPLPSGGILADEMGLGKTVEMLAVILINSKPGSKLRTAAKMEKNMLDDASQEVAQSPEKKAVGKKSKKDRKSKNVKLSAQGSYLKWRKKRCESPCEFLGDASPEDGERLEKEATEQGASSSQLLLKSLISTKKRGRRKGKTAGRKGRKREKSPESDQEIMNSAAPTTSQNSGGRKSRRKNSSANDDIIIHTGATQIVDPQSIPPEIPSGPGKSNKGVLLKQMQSLYSATLSGYDGATNAKVKPRFHGRFYETSLDSRAFFECVCGGFREHGDQVVTCIRCSTSQHPNCVGEHLIEREANCYICPHCTVREELTDASTTLIITPSSISYQWINEIQKHIQIHGKSMNILYYKGVGKHGYLPPAKLAEFDIVITTYTVLQSEINYTDLPHNNSDEGRKFRNPKRFMTIPSPLPCVNWWRICLDEAQMVEGINTKMSMMAKRLKGIHKWCISGTPLNKGLQDLYGLFSFLEVAPIEDEYWWTNLVHDPFYRKETDILYELFGRMIWRTGKSEVLDQLGIPSQSDRTHWLEFSAIETHFYKQQLEACSSRLLHKISTLDHVPNLNTKLSTLDRKTIQSLLQPFLELRQACCHPQMVKGQLISLNKGTLTMEELLEQLTKKTAVMCAEDHRLMVAAWNGLAGLHIIRNEMVEASELYRKVLQSAEKYKEKFPTDSLQLMHTMENLADILDGNYSSVPYTLRDDRLRTDVQQLKERYLEKYQNGVSNAISTLTPLTSSVEDLNNSFHCKSESWWYLVLARAGSVSKIDDLITRIKSDLLENTDKKRKNTKSMANKFEDVFSLERILVENLSALDNFRQSVLESIEELKAVAPAEMVDSAVSCHLRNQSQLYYNNTTSAKCTLCTQHDKMIKYESQLFWESTNASISRTGRKWQQNKLMGSLADDLTEEEKNMALMREEEELFESTEHVQLFGKAVEKSWQDSDTEKTIKILSGFARLNGCSVRILEDGGTHIKLYQAMKKEYKFIRILFRQIFDQVAAVDELNQATTRLRIRYEGEELPSQQAIPNSKKALSSGVSQKLQKLLNIHVVERAEVLYKMEQMTQDAAMGQDSLNLHYGQLVYLNSLKTTGYGKKGSFNVEECPICQSALGTEWSVLTCGHSYCKECINKICPSTSVNFLCPLCRISLKTAEISFVDTNQSVEEEIAGPSKGREPPKEIIGSHSTKIEAVMVQLLKLQEICPGEKVLIFSNWVDVLEILSRAFNQNEIKYCLLGQQDFQKDLKRFKTREDIQVLLMPLSFGAKGLNLIEATHVFLVEPILSKAVELQAIGRVHRIGQTKPTFVHRFYVKRTIEEKLHDILKLHDVSSDEEGSLTLQDLKNILSP